jgi:hypothetical protein
VFVPVYVAAEGNDLLAGALFGAWGSLASGAIRNL